MSSAKRALITGGSGYLGRFLWRRLMSEGFKVDAPTSSQINLLNPVVNTEYCRRRYDVIYHLAAWTQAGDFCLHNKGMQWVNNSLINANFLAYVLANQIDAEIVTIGTSCAYPVGENLTEVCYLTGEPESSLYVYAQTKRNLQIGLESLKQQFGLSFRTFIPSTLVGPHYGRSGKQLHFIFDIAKKIYSASQNGEPPVLWGTGYQRRELISVTDFVEVLLDYKKLPSGEVLNVSNGASYSIRDFAEQLCSMVGYDPRKIIYDPTKYQGAIAKSLSDKKFRKYFQDYKFKSLTTCLEEVLGSVDAF